MLIGIVFLNAELDKPHFLHNEMIPMQCSIQIQQNIYSIGIFHATAVTQLKVKV